LSALKWTAKYSDTSLSQSVDSRFTGPWGEEDCSKTYAEMVVHWPSLLWGSNISTPLYRASWWRWLDSNGWNWAKGDRTRGQAYITRLTSVPVSAADIYIKPENAGDTFVDVDSLALEENKLKLLTTTGSFTYTKLIDDKTGDYSTLPVVSSMFCNNTGTLGCIVNGSYWLLKWGFTYQNT
jgi:hypothetical protein